jgi:hypothetical protein
MNRDTRSFPVYTKPPELTLTHILQALYAPLLPAIDAPSFTSPEGIRYETTNESIWTESLGKKLCIVDIDTRALDDDGQVMGPNTLDWNNVDYSAAGMMNHYVYGWCFNHCDSDID